VGLAIATYGLFTRQPDFVRAGLPVLGIGLGLFLAFGLFFEAVLDLNGLRGGSFDALLAVGLIAIGVLIVVAGAVRRPRLL